jgi:rubrerythrin
MCSALGGDPVTSPILFEKPVGLRGMLEFDYSVEMQDSSNYAMRAQQADKLNKIELKVKLEDMAADEAAHARKIYRIIRGM